MSSKKQESAAEKRIKKSPDPFFVPQRLNKIPAQYQNKDKTPWVVQVTDDAKSNVFSLKID